MVSRTIYERETLQVKSGDLDLLKLDWFVMTNIA
jgi:hypothetical protein